MNKIFMLAFANLRKSKGHTASLFIMFLIAASLLNAGMLILINFGGFFQKTVDELNTSDVYYIMPGQAYNEEVETYITNNDNVLDMQKEETLWGNAEIKYGNDKRKLFFLMNDADHIRKISKWKFVGKHLPADEMSVYLPNVYQLDGGYRLNDKFILSFKDTKITLTVKGFTEDVFFSSLGTGYMGIYLPHESYEKVSELLDDSYRAALIFTNLKKVNKDLETGLREFTNTDMLDSTANTENVLFSLDLMLVMMSRIMMANMAAMAIVSFAFIIVVVCLIVVRFRIGNSIEDDMTKIGSLKAIGYTSRQIILSIAVQFLLIAFTGSVAGISLSYSALPFLSGVFAQQSGLKWVQGFDMTISSLSLGLILFIVFIVALFTARRINHLHPIVAMRGGIHTHSFSKNHFPLSTSIGSLSVILAMKSLLQNIKQSIMITVIMTAVSFAGAFAIGMFYNTTIDTKAFEETPGIEISNALAVFKPDTDKKELVGKIQDLDGVRKTQFIDQVMVKIDNNDISVYVMDDYSQKETNTIYEGRYPLHNNEAAISGHLAEMFEKTIGDSIILKIGEKQESFVITGLTQGANLGGVNASVRSDAIRKLNPDFCQQALQVYLNKGVEAGTFVKELERLYGDSLLSAIDMDKEFKDGVSVYTSIVSKVGIAILIVAVVVVFLVLYFVINSTVVRRRRELGIQKAIGFTTLQLMNQVSLGFLPPVIVGACLGSLIGATQTNAIMSVAQKAMGIMKANYIITPVWIALFGSGVILVSYLTSLMITSRIRKISAYKLVNE